MSDRWIPVLAATVGVLGGVGGALIGGLIANEGRQDQLESERQAALVDMRREVYATYIQALESFIETVAAREDLGGPLSDEEIQELREEEGIPAITAQAAVELVAEDDVREAVQDIDQALEAGVEEDEWKELRKAFIDEANNELFPGE